jgi:hypothetical protein
MHLITPEMVAARIELYFQQRGLSSLTAEQTQRIAPFLHRGTKLVWREQIRGSNPITEGRLQLMGAA